MKLAPDIIPLKKYWESIRGPDEPFCRRCGIPEYAITGHTLLQPFEFAGQSFHLCRRCQKAILDAICPDEALRQKEEE